MANEEHRNLAQFLKEVHSSLRRQSATKGTKEAWNEHCKQNAVLEKYAKCMERLATEYWDINSTKQNSAAVSRIKWTAHVCYEYFHQKTYLFHKAKEAVIANKMYVTLDLDELFSEPIRLIDVGSCYNPFKCYSFMDVFAIDLCPANNSVLQCDFLNVAMGNEVKVVNNTVIELKEKSFEVVTFCFLLEYIPSSELRILACQNAYTVLKPGGLLIIITPDSKHVGSNCKIMKCWRFTLALMGFTRIKYEKLPHMHCMAFRRALHKSTAVRWATLYKESYMDYVLNIPQDFVKEKVPKSEQPSEIHATSKDFMEMPFFGIDDIGSL